MCGYWMWTRGCGYVVFVCVAIGMQTAIANLSASIGTHSVGNGQIPVLLVVGSLTRQKDKLLLQLSTVSLDKAPISG